MPRSRKCGGTVINRICAANAGNAMAWKIFGERKKEPEQAAGDASRQAPKKDFGSQAARANDVLETGAQAAKTRQLSKRETAWQVEDLEIVAGNADNEIVSAAIKIAVKSVLAGICVAIASTLSYATVSLEASYLAGEITSSPIPPQALVLAGVGLTAVLLAGTWKIAREAKMYYSDLKAALADRKSAREQLKKIPRD